MKWPSPNRRMLWPVIALSLPALVVLITLVMLDRLDGGFAIVAGFAVVVAMALLVRTWHADIVAIAGYIGALHRSGAVAVPRLNHPGAFMALLAGARRLRRTIDGAGRRGLRGWAGCRPQQPEKQCRVEKREAVLWHAVGLSAGASPPHSARLSG